jgi:hypothetical protein
MKGRKLIESPTTLSIEPVLSTTVVLTLTSFSTSAGTKNCTCKSEKSSFGLLSVFASLATVLKTSLSIFKM